MTRLLLLKLGSTLPSLQATRGDYEVWFRRGLGVGDSLDVARVLEGEHLPDLNIYGGVVVTGSAAMVTERAAWSVAAAALLREALERDIPVLGVCYGHQLLADALGAEVNWNPRGRQIGTVTATLTSAGQRDPLFQGLPSQLTVQTSHSQAVLAVTEQLQLLAHSPRDPQHAFRVRGARAWGVQFHPEFDAEVTRTYIQERREAIFSEGQDPDQLIASVIESEHGGQILHRFAELCAIG